MNFYKTYQYNFVKLKPVLEDIKAAHISIDMPGIVITVRFLFSVNKYNQLKTHLNLFENHLNLFYWIQNKSKKITSISGKGPIVYFFGERKFYEFKTICLLFHVLKQAFTRSDFSFSQLMVIMKVF